jgi:hypothetical protein
VINYNTGHLVGIKKDELFEMILKERTEINN